MGAPKSLLIVVLISGLPAANLSVDGCEGLCPTDAIVDLTGGTLDSSGFVKMSNATFPPESICFVNDKMFGCSCNFKTYLPLCCPLGYARNENTCIEENTTFATLPRLHTLNLSLDDGEKDIEHFHAFVHDPCYSHSSDFKEVKLYYLLKNGSIHLPDLDQQIGFEMYCLFREVESSTYSAKVCDTRRPVIWRLIAANGSILFALATFVVYSIVPQLRNLHGSIFRLYLASYIGCIVSVQVGIRPIIDVKDHSRMIYAATGIYFCLICVFWLNIMSFDIWWTLRSFQPIQCDIKERDKKKMRYYMIYGWLGPAVLMVIFCLTVLIGNIRDKTIPLVFLVGPIVILGICNTCLYISTAIMVRRLKRETTHLVDGVNKHHKENEQWFNLYLKLFIAMGGPMIWLAVSLLGRTYRLTNFIEMLHLLQCIFVFLIFVWKDDVRQSLAKQYHGVLHQLRSVFQREAATFTTRC